MADRIPARGPSFDVVRVEPDGSAVVAGRSTSGATVELIVDGRVEARVVADPSGLFAFVPSALPPGSHDIFLQATVPDGTRLRSGQSVTVLVAENRRDAPLVTVTAPGQPTVVLSRPEEPARVASATPPSGRSGGADVGSGGRPPAAGPAPPPVATRRADIRIVSVETGSTGQLFVAGQAAPTATVRLYLNDSFVAPGSAAPDGRISFAIERGVRPGDYRVRLDDVDALSGAVKSRAEVVFAMPTQPVAVPSDAGGPVVASTEPATRPVPAPGSRPAGTSPGAPPVADGAVAVAAPATAGDGSKTAAAGGSAIPSGPGGGRAAETVVVSSVDTATVTRGESLWVISKRIYGEGPRYTVIFGANSGQIRDPNRIYPGQVFVVPATNRKGAAR